MEGSELNAAYAPIQKACRPYRERMEAMEQVMTEKLYNEEYLPLGLWMDSLQAARAQLPARQVRGAGLLEQLVWLVHQGHSRREPALCHRGLSHEDSGGPRGKIAKIVVGEGSEFYEYLDRLFQ